MLRKITQNFSALMMLVGTVSPALHGAAAGEFGEGDPAVAARFLVDTLRQDLPDGSQVGIISMADEARLQAEALFGAKANLAIFLKLGVEPENCLFVSWGSTTANLYWMVDGNPMSTAVEVGVKKLEKAADPLAYGQSLRDKVVEITRGYDLNDLVFFNAVGYRIESPNGWLVADKKSDAGFKSPALAGFFRELAGQTGEGVRVVIKQRTAPKLDDGFLTAIAALPGYNCEVGVDVGGGSAKLKLRGPDGSFRDRGELKGADGEKIDTNRVLTLPQAGLREYVETFCRWLEADVPKKPVLAVFTGDVRKELETDQRYQLRLTQGEGQ